MHTIAVPVALTERLGDAGSIGLADMFDKNNRACSDDVLESCGR